MTIEVHLEHGEQVADVHVLPFGEELQELIHTSSAQSHQFQSSHHTRSQHIASSLDHIAALAASLEEGNPVPISFSLSHTVSSSLQVVWVARVLCLSDDSSMDTFIFEDRSDHDDSIALGPCSDDPFSFPRGRASSRIHCIFFREPLST